VKQCGFVSVEMCTTDNTEGENCTGSTLASCTSTAESVSVTSVSVDTSRCTSCSYSESMTSSSQLSLTTSASSEPKRDLPLLSLPVGQSSSTPFSPQTPCSRFGSCVLQLNAAVDCACIAGAVLCRWDNIVGPRIVYVWTTSVEQRSWLAAKNVLSYIARGTLAGEVNRDPHDEVKFFASSDSDVALATIVFSFYDASDVAAESADVAVYSMSVIVPYIELATFLKLKSICLEWLSHAVLQLRVLLSQVPYISFLRIQFDSSVVCGTAMQFVSFYLSAQCTSHVLCQDSQTILMALSL